MLFDSYAIGENEEKQMMEKSIGREYWSVGSAATYFRSYFKIFGSVGKLVGTNTKSSELVFSGLLDSLCSLFPANVIFESSVATTIPNIQNTNPCNSEQM